MQPEGKVIPGLLDSPELKPGPPKDTLADDEDPGKMRRGPKLRDDVQVKICDMGNGCWTYRHFTPEI